MPSATVTSSTPGRPRQRVETPARRTRSARWGCSSLATTLAPAVGRQRGQLGRLAAGAGTQVQPPRVVALDRCRRERERHELRPLVLHPCAPLGDGRGRARVAPCRGHAVRRVGRRLPAAAQRVWGGPARNKGDGGRCVVGRQQRVDLVLTPRPRSAPPSGRRRSTGDGSGRVGAVGVDPGEPGLEVIGGDLAQHRVDEPGRTRARPRNGPGRRSY